MPVARARPRTLPLNDARYVLFITHIPVGRQDGVMRHSPPNKGGFPSQGGANLPSDAPVLIYSPLLAGLAPDTLPKSELTDELNRISHSPPGGAECL